MRIMIVFGTRPEGIKLFPVIHALRAYPDLDVRVCVTGQHRHLLDQVLSVGEIVPDIDLNVMQAEQSLDSLTARLMLGIGKALDEIQPDRVIVQGDTLSAMTATLAAHYRKIPVAHVEAGLRSGDLHHPWPEEAARRIIACMADLHFAPTETAAAALRSEGHNPASIHVTGNSGIDALLAVRDRIAREPELASGMDALAERFGGKRIIAVTAHRRENLGEGMEAIAAAVAEIAGRGDVGVIFPAHPNPAVRSLMQSRLSDLANVALTEPLDYLHFVCLLDLCHLVLTDSGGVQEEAPAFGKPVLVMRETTERPEGVAAGTARLVGTDPDRIAAEVFRLLDDEATYRNMARASNPFGDGASAARIAEIIAGISVSFAPFHP